MHAFTLVIMHLYTAAIISDSGTSAMYLTRKGLIQGPCLLHGRPWQCQWRRLELADSMHVTRQMLDQSSWLGYAEWNRMFIR